MKFEIFKTYTASICSHFSVRPDELFSKTKKREVVDARQLLYYMCSIRPMRLTYIQDFMSRSGYDIAHSSILHGINVVKDKVISDEDYDWLVNKIKNECVLN